jgi:hypothetical protein
MKRGANIAVPKCRSDLSARRTDALNKVALASLFDPTSGRAKEETGVEVCTVKVHFK